MAATQTRRKRRVGAYLRSLRERSDRTMDQAADFLEVKRPTVVRMESGETLCKRRDLTLLVAWYDGSDDELAEALSLWEDAKQDTTHVVLPGSTTPALRSYLRAEADASIEKIIAPHVVHGLLQTYDYATAITQTASGFRPSDAKVVRYVDSRVRRQGRLRGPEPLIVHAVMDESTIRRAVGGTAVMRAQLDRLLALAEQPNITLQVIPFSAGSYGTMSGGSAYLEFQDPADPPAAYVEYAGGGKWVEDPDDVAKLAATFDLVARAALTPTDTVALFRQQIEELENDQPRVAQE